jgi:hypothetical protein
MSKLKQKVDKYYSTCSLFFCRDLQHTGSWSVSSFWHLYMSTRFFYTTAHDQKCIAPILWKADNSQNTNFTGEARRRLVLHIINVLRGTTFPNYSGYYWRWNCHSYISQLHILATHNSTLLKVAVSPFLQNRGDIIIIIYLWHGVDNLHDKLANRKICTLM